MSQVIYHGKCYDGFTAAWIADRAMPGCDLHAAAYGEEPPTVEGMDVYVLDFSYPREVMGRMYAAAKNLTVLDHHKTAEEACRGLAYCQFDMERSGCGMTWDHFFPAQPRPWLVDRIEDRDLWRFKHGDETREAHAFVASQPMTLNAWDAMMRLDPDDVMERGRAILGYINIYIEKAGHEAREVEVEGELVVVVNVPYQNASEMADHLLGKHPDATYSMGYFQRADGRWQYSLRSRSGFDVSEVAERHGGGGHAGAAGFESPSLLVELG